MATERKFLSLTGLEKLVENIKNLDAQVLSDAETYAEEYANSLADNYDPAGTAQTKVDELANGQVKTNTEAIAAINNAETGILKQAKDYTDAEVKELADGQVETNTKAIGTLDSLETTAKEDLVKAINEVRNAVSVGGTAAAVTMDTTTTTDGYLKSYTIKQGSNTVGTIDIPKDMVVESGEVVTNPDGQPEGTYIKLVLANVSEPLYVNVGTLVDIYKAKASATQVQIAIDSATREISASIVAGSITATELATDAVTTVKIADANVTKAKLSTEVQASLNKADAAAPQTSLDAEATRAKEAEAGLEERLADVESQLGTGEGSVEDKISTAKGEAVDEAKEYAEGLNTAMDTRVKDLEADTHTHSNKELLDTYTQTEANLADAVAKKHEHTNKTVLDGITSEKVSAWDSAESNAKTHADGLNTTMTTRVDGLEDRIDTLEGVNFVEITNDEIDAAFFTD